MGVDYDAKGGLGLRITEDILNKLGYDDECLDEFLDNIGIQYISFGNAYNRDENEYAWVVPGKKYIDVKKNIPKFMEDLHKINIDIVEDDLEVIVELNIW